jgi:hypothetical protein
VFREVASEAKTSHTGLAHALEQLSAGDLLVVTRPGLFNALD